MSSVRIRGIALASVFAALTAITAGGIPIFVTPVPVTLQVFFVFLALSLAGPWYGGLSMLIYLFLGALGLPIFAGYTGGLVKLLGPTGGYIFGFPLAAFFGGLVAGKKKPERKRELIFVLAGMLVAISITYGLGVIWLSNYLGRNYFEGFLLGALPFLPADFVKMIIAIPIALRLRSEIRSLPITP